MSGRKLNVSEWLMGECFAVEVSIEMDKVCSEADLWLLGCRVTEELSDSTLGASKPGPGLKNIKE